MSARRPGTGGYFVVRREGKRRGRGEGGARHPRAGSSGEAGRAVPTRAPLEPERGPPSSVAAPPRFRSLEMVPDRRDAGGLGNVAVARVGWGRTSDSSAGSGFSSTSAAASFVSVMARRAGTRGAGRRRGDAERVRRERRTLGEGDASVGRGGAARARGGRACGARRARRRDGRAAEDGVRGHGRHCSMPFRVRMRAERVRRGPRAVAPGAPSRRARGGSPRSKICQVLANPANQRSRSFTKWRLFGLLTK